MLQVFVTAQARTIELATCYVLQPTSVMVTVSADVTDSLLQRLNQYIFFGDEVRAAHARIQNIVLMLQIL